MTHRYSLSYMWYMWKHKQKQNIPFSNDETRLRKVIQFHTFYT